MDSDHDEATLLLRSKKKLSKKRSLPLLSHSGESEGGDSLPQHYGSSSIRRLQEVTPVGLSWHDLTVIHTQSQKKILHNISGIAEPGQFVALMGSR